MLKCSMVIFAILILAGCAGSPTYYKPILKKFSYPPVDQKITISLGENMLHQGLSSKVRALDLSKNVSVSLGTLMTNTYIATGYVGDSVDRVIYEPENRGPAFLGIYSFTKLVINEKQNLACLYDSSMGLLLESTDCSNLDKVLANGQMYYKNIYNSSSLQQTLIYTGKVNNRVRFAYREFSGNSARMPFSTDVEYDLDESNIISYQGATIEILQANNRAITYRVINNFRNYR